MKKVLVISVTGGLVLGVTSLLALSKAAQSVEHLFGVSVPERPATLGDGITAKANSTAEHTSDSAPSQSPVEIKAYDAKVKDAALYARARSLIQITQLLGETKDKLMTPLKQQLDHERRDPAAGE